MKITNRASGPQFSTDAVAHDVSRFMAERRTMTACAGPAAAPAGRVGALEELYPSLFEAPAPSLAERVSAALRHLAARIRSLAVAGTPTRAR